MFLRNLGIVFCVASGDWGFVLKKFLKISIKAGGAFAPSCNTLFLSYIEVIFGLDVKMHSERW